jgi:DNA mismatch endonuclease, patch repair protein
MARIDEKSRTRVMSAIKRRDTKSELILRSALWRRGLRGYRVDAHIVGRPDIVFPKFRLCIFVDGCFWHGCPYHYKGVSSNVGYWVPKIEKNRQRDAWVSETLINLGYRVKRFWDHELVGGSLADAVNEIYTTIEEIKRTGNSMSQHT